MDKSLAKKYTKIAVTLGVIAGGSALLIGLANVITEGPIKQNEINKKLESIKVVYGDNAKYSNEVVISSEHKEAYPHLLSYYNAKDANDKELGNVFVTEGKNQFGAIKMAVGVGTDYQFDKISLIVNEQTLPNEVNSFVDKVNKGGNIDDVKCGATYGATLINEMAKESLSYYKNVILENSGVETRDFLANIFGENSKYGEEVIVENPAYKNIKSYYTASSSNGTLLGYVFIAEGQNENPYGPIKMSVGIKLDGTIGKVFIIENGQTNGMDKTVQSEYVDKYNKGEIQFDDVKCGATYGATLINEMGKEALKYYKGEIKKQIVDFAPYCAQVFTDEGAKFIRHNLIDDPTYPNIKEYWSATSKTGALLGRVYRVNFADNNYMVGVNAVNEGSHTLKGVFMVNAGDSQEAKTALELIEKINAGEDVTKIVEGDAGLILEIKTSVKQSLGHAKAFNVAAPSDMSAKLAETFDSVNNASYCEHAIYDNEAYPTIIEYWNVKDEKGLYQGRVYHVSIPGATGNNDALIAVEPGDVLGSSLYKIIANSEADGSKLTTADAYISQLKANPDTVVFPIDSPKDPLKGTGNVAERNFVRSIVMPALMHYGENIIPEVYLDNVFEHAQNKPLNYVNNTVVSMDGNVREYWNVMDAKENYIGRVYHTAFKGRHATINAIVGFKTVITPVPNDRPKVEHKLEKMYLINKANGLYGDKLQAYVDNLNAGNLSMQDDIHNGASASTGGARAMVNEAFEHYVANPILPLYKGTENLDILFDKHYNFTDHRLVEESAYPNVVEYWNVKDNEGQPVAYAYHCALPGKHSTMELTVSVTTKQIIENNRPKVVAEFGKIHLFATAPNEYGEILQNYVNGLNNKTININDDVHNGATSSSNGVKTLVLQAMAHAVKYQLDAGVEDVKTSVDAFIKDAYSQTDKASASATPVNNLAYGNLLEYFEVTNQAESNIGRVYHASLPGEHAVLHVLVAVDNEGNFKKVNWIGGPDISDPGYEVPKNPYDPMLYAYKAAVYIDKVNKGEINIYDDVNNGATGTTAGILSLIHQSLDHYNATKIGG